MKSPALNGLVKSSTIPDARLDRLSLIAKATAAPTAASTASKLPTGKPSLSIAITIASAQITILLARWIYLTATSSSLVRFISELTGLGRILVMRNATSSRGRKAKKLAKNVLQAASKLQAAAITDNDIQQHPLSIV